MYVGTVHPKEEERGRGEDLHVTRMGRTEKPETGNGSGKHGQKPITYLVLFRAGQQGVFSSCSSFGQTVIVEFHNSSLPNPDLGIY